MSFKICKEEKNLMFHDKVKDVTYDKKYFRKVKIKGKII